jgi:chitin disaccharide deacetylase
LGNPAHNVADVQALFAELPAGLTYVICHPAADSPELRAIAPDWRARVRDYAVMTDPALRVAVGAQGIHLIGWRDIQRAMRG